MKLTNVGILLFDEVEVLDFAGPFEVFAITQRNNKKVFNVFTVAEKKELTARNGLEVNAKYFLDDCPDIDILVIPGGYGAEHVELYNEALIEWVKKQHQSAKITFSICTGAFILAEAKILDGLKATTHWMDYDRLENDYPHVNVIRNVRYVDEDKVITAGGISSGINTSLYLISRLLGADIAVETAKRMEFDCEL